MKPLDGQVAWVTGGSRGLGRALVRKLAENGAYVAFSYSRSTEEAEITAAKVQAAGGRCRAFEVNVTDRNGARNLCRSVEEELGQPISILVNNAGFGQVVPVALMEEEDWDRMMDTHVKGAFLSSQAVLRGMIRIKYGRILNVGSLAGTKMMQAPVHYATAKAALKGFTEALAKEVGRYGITVNNIAPGVLDEGVSQHLPPDRLAEFLRHCSLGRTGSSAEIAEVVAFLVSPLNSFMSGATIVVDGAV